MVAKHTGNVSVIAGDGGVPGFLNLSAGGIQLFPGSGGSGDPGLVKDRLVVEECKYVGLVGDGL